MPFKCEKCGRLLNVGEGAVCWMACAPGPQDTPPVVGLKAGDVVTVYDDPLTKTRPEGQAILRKLEAAKDRYAEREYWQVDFLEEPGVLYTRFIAKEG